MAVTVTIVLVCVLMYVWMYALCFLCYVNWWRRSLRIPLVAASASAACKFAWRLATKPILPVHGLHLPSVRCNLPWAVCYKFVGFGGTFLSSSPTYHPLPFQASQFMDDIGYKANYSAPNLGTANRIMKYTGRSILCVYLCVYVYSRVCGNI